MKRAPAPIRRLPEAGVAIISLGDGKEAVIDIQFADRAGQFPWRYFNGYAVGRFRLDGISETWFLHRLIIGAGPGELVDHINGDQLDNRASNLRIATVSQNAWNRRVSSRNTTGCTGIYYVESKRLWTCRLGFNRKRIYVGNFHTFEEAAAARRAAELKYYGEFAPCGKEGMQ